MFRKTRALTVVVSQGDRVLFEQPRKDFQQVALIPGGLEPLIVDAQFDGSFLFQ